MKATYNFRWFLAFGLVAVVLILKQSADAYPVTECIYYPPDYYPDVYPQFTQAVIGGVPEPGLTNESITVSGSVMGYDGSVTKYQASDNCPPLSETVPWPQTVFISWASYSLPGGAMISGLSGSDHIPESSFFGITYVPQQAGDEKLVVYFRGEATYPLANYSYPSINPINVPVSVFPRQRLSYFSFNTTTWEGSLGQLPMTANNVLRVPSPFGRGINFDSTSSIELKYPAYQNDIFAVSEPDLSTMYSVGSPNVRLNEGTVRFWYSPNWSSGSGPNNGVLFQFFAASSYLCRQIQIAANGTTIKIDSVPFPITLTANKWYQIAAVYSATSTVIYTNGVQAGSIGIGVSGFPQAVLTNFRIGSDGSSGQARGVMDEVETFNYAMPASEVLAAYQAAALVDTDGDGIPDLQEFQAGIDLFDPPGGNPVGNPPPASNPSDTTPPVINLIEPINAE